MSLVTLIELVHEYFDLPDGLIIENHTELLKVVDIKMTITEHPHINKKVYITRRALKHFVESRRADLLKKHTVEEALQRIVFTISVVSEVILEFENYELIPPNNHFYNKDYSTYGMPMVRVLLEAKDDFLCVKSIHFAKRTRKHRS